MKARRYNWLADLINTRRYKVGAEVGAATGVTTRFLLDNCARLRKLTIVDIWKPVDSPQWNMDNMEEIFMKKFKNDSSRLLILKGLSWLMAQEIKDESLDFVFIDADHSFKCVKKDIIAWTPKIRKGGVLCGHDINLFGVHKAVNELLIGWNDSQVDHVWYYYRKK